MLSAMSTSLLRPYRNVQNGAIGFVTDEQAAVFPELLEFVVGYIDPSDVVEIPVAEVAPPVSAPILTDATGKGDS